MKLTKASSRVLQKVNDFRYVEDHFTWNFAGIYGTNSDCDRRFLSEELVGLLGGTCHCASGGFHRQSLS